MSLSGPTENPDLVLLSLGAGVQSSVVALLASRGEIKPMPHGSVFADTQWEPRAVYEHLDWLEAQLAFPVYRVTAGDIRQNLVEKQNSTGGRFASVPFHLRYEDGSPPGMGRRQCTREYKIDPIHKQVRTLLGLQPRQRAKNGTLVEQWIGISTDELGRMKDSQHAWVKHRWPLIEMGWTRQDCQRWFNQEYPGRHLPRSSCVGCPFHKDAHWKAMQRDAPEEFADAVEMDRIIREPARVMRGEQFMHRSLQPLDEIDFGYDPDQHEFGFLSECEGMCGV